jgi:hypothetical protein
MITTTDRWTGAAACIGGAALAILGIISAIDSDLVGTVWFIVAALSIWLFAAGVLGLSRSVTTPRVARGALTAAAGALFLFGAAHFYTLVDEDTAILLFSVFMILSAIGLIIAGLSIIRHSAGGGWSTKITLVCGAWPLLTIPVGAALGDIPHFGAIAVWGLTMIIFGVGLRNSTLVGTGASVAVPRAATKAR